MARPRAPAAAAGACLAVAVLFAASAAGQEYVRSWTVTDFSNLTLFEGSAVDFFPEYVEFAHEAGQTFAIWWAAPLLVRGFRTTFTVQFLPYGNDTGATLEGVVFHVQNDDGVPGGGGYGPGLGYHDTIEKDFAVEFDCLRSDDYDAALPDDAEWHVSAHTLGEAANSADEATASQDGWREFVLEDFCDPVGEDLTFSFEYEPRTEDGEAYRFTVRKSTIPGPIISNSYNLETIGLDANHQARIGFTGSSTLEGGRFRLLSWSYEFLGLASAADSTVAPPFEDAYPVGDIAEQTLTVRDQYGNPYVFDDAVVAAQAIAIGAPATNIATVTPLAPGQFRISLNTTVAAVYQVRVTVNDEVVPAAAAAVEYRPGPVAAEKCVVDGPMPPATAEAGSQAALDIQAYDQYDNPLDTSGGDVIVAELTPATENNTISVEDNDDGTYTVAYTITVAGNYTLTVAAGSPPNRVTVPGFPYALTYHPGPTSAANCEVSCPTAFTAGERYECTIVARDEFGNAVPSTTDNFVAALLPAAAGSAVATVNDGPGTYVVHFHANTTNGPDGYALQIRLGLADVAESPYPVPLVPAAVSYATSRLDGVHDTMAGEAGSFTVQAKDVYGNAYWTSPPASFRPWVSVGSVLNLTDATDLGDGRLRYDYNMTLSGTFDVNVRSPAAPHEHAAGSPSPTHVAIAPVSAAHSFVLPEFEYDTGMATRLTYFEIQLTDAFGNNYTTGGAELNVTVEPAESNPGRTAIPVDWEDQNNGIYVVSYRPAEDQWGAYVMLLLVNGDPMFGGPVDVAIEGEDKSNTVLWAILGSIAGLALIGLVAFVVYRRRKRQAERDAVENLHNESEALLSSKHATRYSVNRAKT